MPYLEISMTAIVNLLNGDCITTSAGGCHVASREVTDDQDDCVPVVEVACERREADRTLLLGRLCRSS